MNAKREVGREHIRTAFYHKKVDAVLVQVFHSVGQIPRFPLWEGILVVWQRLNIWPDLIVRGPQSPKTQINHREGRKRRKILYLVKCLDFSIQNYIKAIFGCQYVNRSESFWKMLLTICYCQY